MENKVVGHIELEGLETLPSYKYTNNLAGIYTGNFLNKTANNVFSLRPPEPFFFNASGGAYQGNQMIVNFSGITFKESQNSRSSQHNILHNLK